MQEALERLYRRRTFGIKLGLDVEQELLETIGNPERHYGIIHVAGTNGKGSVCALLDSILRSAGYKVGLYTSPHLVRFNERIRVDGHCIEDDELGVLVAEIERLASAVEVKLRREPTFFECATAMALKYFRQQGVQIAILETGMGGRLDATNVATPLMSLITRISMEHTMYLGSDIESIAFEKCGIIKQERPVVCGMMDERPLNVVRRIARERRATLVEASGNVSVRMISQDFFGQKVEVETGTTSFGTMQIPLTGRHQLENLATAVAAIEVFGRIIGTNIREEDVRTGVLNVNWPGRCQVLSIDPPFILDGAHNPGAAEALAETLRQVLKEKPIGLVLGMCSDKDMRSFLKPFSKLVKKLWAVPIKSDRSVPTAQIISAGKGMGWGVSETTLAMALSEAESWARENGGAVCVTGSLFLVGEVLGGIGKTTTDEQ